MKKQADLLLRNWQQTLQFNDGNILLSGVAEGRMLISLTPSIAVPVVSMQIESGVLCLNLLLLLQKKKRSPCDLLFFMYMISNHGKTSRKWKKKRKT